MRRRAGTTTARRLLVANAFLFLCALSLASITAEGPATRTLARTAGVLIEIDAYLDTHWSGIQQQAAQPQDKPSLLPGFALPVSFTPAELRDVSRDDFRRALLTRSGRLLYDRGAGAFRAEADTGQPAAQQGSVSAFIDLLRPAPHRALLVATGALATTAALLVFRIAGTAGATPLTRIVARALLLGSAAFLACALAARLTLVVAARAWGGYLTRELLSTAGQLSWAGVRDGATVVALAVIMLGIELALPRRSGANEVTSVRSP